MIQKNTVLILGAGASAPYGLPVGSGLREKILRIPAAELDSVPVGPGSARTVRGSGYEFLNAFRQSQCYSIDAFLARRSEFSDVGKHAIVRVLLPMENLVALVDSDPLDHWYRYLLGVMDAPWEDFHKNKLSIVTFNYDRSFETILISTLRARYGKPEKEALKMMENFEVVHVYGSMGSLDPALDTFVPYGGATNPNEYYFRAAQNLRVIPEGRDDSAEFIKAKELVSDADVLVFMGFGFDKINVDRLGGTGIYAGYRPVTHAKPGEARIAATTFGLTTAERRNAANRIAIGPGVDATENQMFNKTCLDMLRESLVLGGD